MSLIYQKRILALAGLFQSIHLVINVAKTGMVGQDSLEKSLNCIFVQNPESISAIYNGTEDIKLGLNLLADVLRKFDPQAHAELIRYSLAVMALERSLAAKPKVLSRLGDMIDELQQGQQQAPEQFDAETRINRLAKIYEATISTIEPRVKIGGNRLHLQAPENIQRIRALLLSAVRSSVLWQQLGGRRWQLLFSRRNMKEALSHVK